MRAQIPSLSARRKILSAGPVSQILVVRERAGGWWLDSVEEDDMIKFLAALGFAYFMASNALEAVSPLF
jgi:hypothetical protein